MLNLAKIHEGVMKLQFSANQEYQLEAIKSVVELFRGQPGNGDELRMEAGPTEGQMKIGNDILVGNALRLDEETILKNLRDVQYAFNYVHEEPNGAGGLVGGIQQSERLESMDFTVEMETGTGKTYVYLRTIHELHRQYGFKKFVIVVPSLAIREGVLKNLQVTQEHFANLYNKPKMDFYVYDPKKRGQLRNFARQNTLQILVINIDSFASEKKTVIHQKSDDGIPVEFLQAVRPIVIVDEPQNMETEIRKKAITKLNPLCTLRYSATHKNLYHQIYKLDPVRAYDLGLVKKIEVDSILSDSAFSHAYIKLIDIVRKSKTELRAKVEVDKSDEGGLQKKIFTIESGDDLYLLTNKRDAYQGYVLDEIRTEDKSIVFTNGERIYRGKTDSGLSQDVMKYQIFRTVEDHFEKEIKLKERGIKVLTLFFIDKVANYREYSEAGAVKGVFARWFEEAYSACQKKYPDACEYSAERVHNGYFAQDGNSGQWKDSSFSHETKADDNTYDLIMRDKERLLDVNEPLRFIFSHSALREGWDNPNVFQICTLNQTSSEMKKRQEIGRGLRLPVDSNGERVMDASVNVLTVIANESYEDFANSLQKEIEEECGVSFGNGRIKDRAKKKILRVRKGFELDPNFQELWRRIRERTSYHVEFSTDDLIKESAKRLKEATIVAPKIRSIRAELGIGYGGVTTVVGQAPRGKNIDPAEASISDIISGIQRGTKLTKPSIVKILTQSGKIGDILLNPQQLIDEAIRVVGEAMKSLMVDGIKYEKIAGSYWEMTQFQNRELDGYLNSLYVVRNTEKTVYDFVPWDSEIEHQFVQDMEAREDVKFYIKLPDWFTIKTPLGRYNPDWAIVFENDSKVYFVAETKGAGELRPSEDLKIKCGAAHFSALKDVRFQRVERLKEIEM
jgi:type III restriction enzyme